MSRRYHIVIDFQYVMDNPSNLAVNPCGYSVINQYRSAVLEIHAQQRDKRSN